MTEEIVPRWDVSTIFPSLTAPEYGHAIDKLVGMIANCDEQVKRLKDQGTAQNCAAVLTSLNSIFEHGGTIRAYLQSFITTDTRNQEALRLNSAFEKLYLDVQNLHLHFQVWIGSKTVAEIETLIAGDPVNFDHAFALRNLREQASFLMPSAMEELANELALSGASAWGKLQGNITSQLAVDFEVDGQINKIPMPALINYRSHPEESTRKKAYEVEMAAWKTVEVPLAAALNGVKGATNTLEKRRGREDCLHSAIDSARISRKTLEAMIGSMEASLPSFERYFLSKAKRLGKEKLAWWDIFAPDSHSASKYSWPEAEAFILQHFNSFSPELSDFAKRAFQLNWIDAEQRDGKHGGAFCMSVPGKKESRILCNFDGSLDQVGTIAHELGHAFHNECAYKANKTEFQQDTPMTLAETASIMCETIIVEALLKQTSDKTERLNILGNSLVGSGQVIVDIYSRFLFEKEIFERREQAELSADEICDAMERAQKKAYGNSLDHNHLNRYAWTWKPHYYYAGLSFYNFPYAFGLLFSKGLYVIYQQRGPSFLADYTSLLSSTGEASAEELALRFGINIEERKFWDDSLAMIEQEIEQYIQL